MKKLVLFLLVMGMLGFSSCSFPEDAKPDSAGGTAATSGGGTAETQNTEKELEESKKPTGTEKRAIGGERLSITLYYQDGDGYVIPATRRVVKQEGIAKAALNGLIDSAANREELMYFGLHPVLPAGTQVFGINLKDGVAVVDFDKKLLEYKDRIAERNIISSIVYTLTEFKTIKGVKILVNGYAKDKLQYGTVVSGILNRDNVLINAERVNLKEGMRKADAYLFKKVKEDCAYILPLSVEYEILGNSGLPGKIVQLLTKAWQDDRLYSEVPSSASLIGSSISKGLLTLNFDGGILDYGGQAREEGIIKQILYSMKQVEGVEKVKLLVNGRVASLPEGTDVSKEMPAPKEINDVIDVIEAH